MSDHIDRFLIDRMLDEVKQTVDMNARIAANSFPRGVELRCAEPFCGHTEEHSTDDVARFLTRGWPKHHDLTMQIVPPTPSTRPLRPPCDD